MTVSESIWWGADKSPWGTLSVRSGEGYAPGGVTLAHNPASCIDDNCACASLESVPACELKVVDTGTWEIRTEDIAWTDATPSVSMITLSNGTTIALKPGEHVEHAGANVEIYFTSFDGHALKKIYTPSGTVLVTSATPKKKYGSW